MALNAKLRMMMALNVDLKTDNGSERRNWKYGDGSERRNWERWWLWTPNRINDDGSERQTENDDGSERRNWKYGDGSERRNWERWWLLTPNWDRGSECQIGKWTMALNTKWKKWLWTPNRKTNNGSERQNEAMALNTKWKTMALNANLNWITMNVKLRRTTLNVITRNARKLWTLNWKGMMRGDMPQCSVSPQLSIHRKGLEETP